MADHEAAHQFNRRMLAERGIDPGPDHGAQPYEPGLYLKHVPTIDIGAAPRKSVLRQVAVIVVWSAVAWGGLQFGGWV